MRLDLVWEATNEDGKNGWQLAEVICPWAWIAHDGETLEKVYEKRLGKYDQLRREISEAYPGHPVVQSTIVVAATGVFMKKSLAESVKVTKASISPITAAGWLVQLFEAHMISTRAAWLERSITARIHPTRLSLQFWKSTKLIARWMRMRKSRTPYRPLTQKTCNKK
jgi:hypothetical protein